MKQFDLTCEGLFDKLRSYLPTLKQTMQGQKDTRPDQLRNRIMIGAEKISNDITDYIANAAQTLEAQSGQINYGKDHESINWKDPQQLTRALNAIRYQYPNQENNVKLAEGVYNAYQKFINALYGEDNLTQPPQQLPQLPPSTPRPPQLPYSPRPQLPPPPQPLPKRMQLPPPSGPSKGPFTPVPNRPRLTYRPQAQLPAPPPVVPKTRQLPPPSGPSKGPIEVPAAPWMRRRGAGGKFLPKSK